MTASAEHQRLIDLDLRHVWHPFTQMQVWPEDEPLIHEFVKHVTMEDLRLRFLAPMKHFSHEFIARLTQLDYARAMAFVALDEANRPRPVKSA